MNPVCENEGVQVAIALFPGVSADECEAFTLAFDQLIRNGADVELIGVGAALGEVRGPGGSQQVDAVFDQVTEPDVVLVPGGLGVDRTAHDDELLAWLRGVEPGCQWMAASSTGTVVVAAAGLLGDRPAATHWLAGPMLQEYGSAASSDRIVEVGRVLTCHGHISAMDVALLMIVRLFNRETAARVRSQLAAGGGGVAVPSDRHSLAARLRDSALVSRLISRRSERKVVRPRNEELDTSEWIEMELTEEPTRRRR